MKIFGLDVFSSTTKSKAPTQSDYLTKAQNQQALNIKSRGTQVNRVTPSRAKATPHRYDKLASEGYNQNVIAYRSINLVARGVGSIPLELFSYGKKLHEHPLLDILKNPNPMQKGASFVYNLTGYYMIAGNAYVMRVGPSKGAPQELWLMRPDTMEIITDGDGTVSQYKQRMNGLEKRFASDTIHHWKSFNPLNDWYGMAPLEAAALAIDNHNEGSRWNLALIQNGGAPSGVMYQEGETAPLTDEQFDRLKDQIDENYTGSANAGRPLLLEGGLRWQDMGLSPKDMDWGAGKNTAAREIAMAFGVPGQLVGIPDSQTYANMAEARLMLWEDTIIPLAKELVSGLNGWLVPAFDDMGDGLELRLNLDDIPALEMKRQTKFDRIQSADFMKINEKREAIGLEPIDGGDRLPTEMTSAAGAPNAAEL